MAQFKYSKAQKGRHIAKHLFASADAMVHALPENGVGEYVQEFCDSLGRATALLKGRQGLPRAQQVEKVTEARALVEQARVALKQIIEAHSESETDTNLLVDADAVLVKADGHLDSLLTFVKERRQPYSGEPRSYFPGENDTPEDGEVDYGDEDAVEDDSDGEDAVEDEDDEG